MMSKALPQDSSEDSTAARHVVLSQRDIEDASRLLAILVKDTSAVAASGSLPPVTRVTLVAAAQAELKARDRRSQLLPEGLFGEPAWEILLLLYVEQARMRLTISRVSTILATAPTTVLRWMSYLQDRQLIVRQNHPTDQRAMFVELTEKALDSLNVYFTEKLERGA